MTAPQLEQPRDDAGRFARYVRPAVPASRPRHRSVTVQVDASRPAGLDGWEERQLEDGTAYRVRRLTDSVPLSAVSVCCPECVYGAQD